MPIFEYRCLDCGSKFEVLVRSQSQGIACEKCYSFNLQKLISMFGISSDPRGALSAPSSTSKCSSCSAASCSTCH